MDKKTLFNKMIFNKRMNLINKTNCFFKETPSIEKITFRGEEQDTSLLAENKENFCDLINKTIKLKEKTVSNISNLFPNSKSTEKFEKSTPGFNKHQKRFGFLKKINIHNVKNSNDFFKKITLSNLS